MTTLKEAQKTGKIDEFIKEHEKDAAGDLDKFKATVKNMARNIRTQKLDTTKGKTTPKG